MRGESTGLAYCGEARTKTLQAVVGRGCSHKTLFPRTLSQDTLRGCSHKILIYRENALTRYSCSHKRLSQDALTRYSFKGPGIEKGVGRVRRDCGYKHVSESINALQQCPDSKFY